MNRLPRQGNHRTPCPHLNKNSLKHLSLYNQLLLFSRITRDFVKLNSTNKSQITNIYDEKFTPQRIEFMHTPNNINMTVRRSFSMLENVEKTRHIQIESIILSDC
ncbi:hypothetical protein DMUE_1391 [Dictyocoela muelleri]|nr:hypothetical protein DMUE_1391 [Dictyocoela muelleri]